MYVRTCTLQKTGRRRGRKRKEESASGKNCYQSSKGSQINNTFEIQKCGEILFQDKIREREANAGNITLTRKKKVAAEGRQVSFADAASNGKQDEVELRRLQKQRQNDSDRQERYEMIAGK